jgi:hypothetical protein
MDISNYGLCRTDPRSKKELPNQKPDARPAPFSRFAVVHVMQLTIGALIVAQSSRPLKNPRI